MSSASAAARQELAILNANQPYIIAFTALTAVCLPVIFYLLIGPRKGFTWLKVLVPLWFMSLLLETIGYAIYIHENGLYIKALNGSSAVPSQRLLADLSEAINRTTSLATLFECLSTICLIIAVVEIGGAFLSVAVARPDGSKSSRGGLERLLVYVFCFALFGLAVGWFANEQAVYTPYYNWWRNRNINSNDNSYTYMILAWEKGRRVDAKLISAFHFATGAAAVLMVIYSGYLLARCKASKEIGNSTVLFLVAMILNFARALYHVVYDGLYELNLKTPTGHWAYIVLPILVFWTFSAMLVLLVMIGRRKVSGAWITNVSAGEFDYAHPGKYMQAPRTEAEAEQRIS